MRRELSTRNALYTAGIGADPLALRTGSSFRRVAPGRVQRFRLPTSTDRRLSRRPSTPITPHHRDLTAIHLITSDCECQRNRWLTRTQFVILRNPTICRRRCGVARFGPTPWLLRVLRPAPRAMTPFTATRTGNGVCSRHLPAPIVCTSLYVTPATVGPMPSKKYPAYHFQSIDLKGDWYRFRETGTARHLWRCRTG